MKEEIIMPFRTLEISNPAELNVNKGQLEINNSDGLFKVPLEDLATIVCSGANIRLSTMAQVQIAKAGIAFMVIDEKYHPACTVLPFESNVRQSLVMRHQIALDVTTKNQIWTELITRKIENQARALALLGREGTEKILHYADGLSIENVDAREASAAKDYFYYLHPGLNRRNDDPVNSCLNYGYAVLRNAIIRSAILAGFQLSFGLHHDNYLNSFNLADDLIEPWRPFVDIIAMVDPGTSSILNRSKRKQLAMVLHYACMIQGKKLSVLTGIEEMINSIRNRVVSSEQIPLKLPIIIPTEIIDAIKE